MSIVTYPSGLRVAKFTPGVNTYDLMFGSSDTGAQQARILGPQRWTAALVSPPSMTDAQAAQWTALNLSLAGNANQLALPFARLQRKPAPRGTARGSWTANATANAGATTLSVNMGVGQANTTVLQGDWVGVNQGATNRQLVHVLADAQADGSGIISLQIGPPLRVSVAGGSAIVWDSPVALFRRATRQTQWSVEPGAVGGFSLDLIESWEG